MVMVGIHQPDADPSRNSGRATVTILLPILATYRRRLSWRGYRRSCQDEEQGPGASNYRLGPARRSSWASANCPSTVSLCPGKPFIGACIGEPWRRRPAAHIRSVPRRDRSISGLPLALSTDNIPMYLPGDSPQPLRAPASLHLALSRPKGGE